MTGCLGEEREFANRVGTEHATWSQTIPTPKHTLGTLATWLFGEMLLSLRVTLESGRGGMVS